MTMRFYKVAIVAGILSLSLGWGMHAQVKIALADDKVDPVSEVFDIYAELLKRHLVEKDLENDGLATAFDYQGALKRDDTMDLLDRQRQKLARFDVSLIDSREKGNAFRKYADDRVIEMMDRTEQMRFIDYDWTLNAPENFPEFN